ncbi:hypothetical protein [Ilumatobacter sp.]|uniref:hypothetical protein n=1 Tax=Ilumatobacter sp. TaxID=1967498 RepID=UPI003B518094
MLAITLDDAGNIAVGLVGAFLVGSVAAAWIVKSIIQKLLAVGVLVLFAFAVWTQRTALEDCADKVRAAYEMDGVNPRLVDTDCSFFGTTITVSDPRDDSQALSAPTTG